MSNLDSYLGDGDGGCSLSAFMFQYGQFWSYAFNNYNQSFCIDISNYSNNDYIIDPIDITHLNRLRMAKIIWLLKSIKMSYQAKASTGCNDEVNVKSGVLHETAELNFTNANTGQVDPSLDTHYNRHLYFSLSGGHSNGDGTGYCPNDPPDTLPSNKYHNHHISAGAGFSLYSPNYKFRYFFNGNTDNESNLVGMGFINLITGQLSMNEEGASQNPNINTPAKRVEKYTLGSIVPKTKDGSVNLNWWGAGNPDLQESGYETIMGLDFPYSIGRNISHVSTQTGDVTEQDINNMGQWQSLTFQGATFK